MIDIITVVFEPEIPVLKVQAQSIALYGQRLGISNIYVVLNDSQTTADKIDAAWWGPLSQYVSVIPRTMFSSSFVENSWVSQQVLKLLASSISYNTYSMILDAKTVLVKPLDPQEFISKSGQISTGIMNLYPVFEPSRQIVNKLFDINLTQQIGPGGVPFIVRNDIVRSMIAEITQRTETSFPTWFQQQGMVTEFVLYSGYVQLLFGHLTGLYSELNKLGMPCNLSHDETDLWSTKIKQMRSPETVTVSIHRNAWTKLSVQQRQEYKDLLVSLGMESAQNL